MHPFSSVLAQTSPDSNQFLNQLLVTGKAGSAFFVEILDLLKIVFTTTVGFYILGAAVGLYLFRKGRAILFSR